MKKKPTKKTYNIIKLICNHLIGDAHTLEHRLFVGAIIMVMGVSIVKTSLIYDSHLLHFICDVTGYGLHGIGLTPFVELIIKQK